MKAPPAGLLLLSALSVGLPYTTRPAAAHPYRPEDMTDDES